MLLICLFHVQFAKNLTRWQCHIMKSRSLENQDVDCFERGANIQMQCHDLDSLLSVKCSLLSSISGRTFVLNFLGFWLTFKIVHSESVGAFNNWKGSPLGGSSLLHLSQKSKSQSSLLALTLYILMYPLRKFLRPMETFICSTYFINHNERVSVYVL